MQVYEFYATVQNGFIKIPDEYAEKIEGEIRVILFLQEKFENQESPVRRSMSDLIGVFTDCGNVDLEQIRTERLHKYESLD